jgi:hypothetical protein
MSSRGAWVLAALLVGTRPVATKSKCERIAAVSSVMTLMVGRARREVNRVSDRDVLPSLPDAPARNPVEAPGASTGIE